MAKEGSSNTAIVVIFLVAVLAIAAFIVYQGGYLTGEAPSSNTNIEVKLPTTSSVETPKEP